MFWISIVLFLYNFSNVKGQNQDFRLNNGFDVPLSENVIIGDEIPGIAGLDYPTYAKVPRTSFRCDSVTFPGYYADPGSRCQAFYICQRGGKGFGFLCPNGTLFSQEVLVCDWWNNVQCDRATEFYDENQRIFTEMNVANERLGIPTIRTPVRGGGGDEDNFGGNTLDDQFPDQPFGPNQFGGSNQRPSFPGPQGLRPGFGNQGGPSPFGDRTPVGPSPFGDRTPTGQRPSQGQRPGQGRPTGPGGGGGGGRFPGQQGRPIGPAGGGFQGQGRPTGSGSGGFPGQVRPIGGGRPGQGGGGPTTPANEFGRPSQGTSFRPTYGRPGSQDSGSGFPTSERPGGFGRPGSQDSGSGFSTSERPTGFGRPGSQDSGSGFPTSERPTGFGRPSTQGPGSGYSTPTSGYPTQGPGSGYPTQGPSSGYPTQGPGSGGYGRPQSPSSGYPAPGSDSGYSTPGGNRPTPGYGGPGPNQYPDYPSYNQPDDNINFNRPDQPLFGSGQEPGNQYSGYPSPQNQFGPGSSQTGGRPNTDLEGPGGNYFYEPNKEQPNDGSGGYNYDKPQNGLDDFNGYQYNKPSRGYLPSF